MTQPVPPDPQPGAQPPDPQPGGWADYPPQQPYPPAPYGQQPPYGYPPVVYVQAAPPTSGMATASLVLALLGVVASWWTLWIPTFLAILFGHVGLSDTKHGLKGGRGLAVAGLIVGYLMLAPLVFLLVGFFASRSA